MNLLMKSEDSDQWEPETVVNLLMKSEDSDQWELSTIKLTPSRRNDVITLHVEGLPYGR